MTDISRIYSTRASAKRAARKACRQALDAPSYEAAEGADFLLHPRSEGCAPGALMSEMPHSYELRGPASDALLDTGADAPGRTFFSDCVAWPDTCKAHFGSTHMLALHLLIDESEAISLEDFRKSLDADAWEDLQDALGYTPPGMPGLGIAEDACVEFRREPVSGVVFAVHSRIEHVFATPEEVDRLQERAVTFDADAPDAPEP